MAATEDPRAQGGRPAQRKLVSPDRLILLLNERLGAYGHCHSCRFMGPVRALREPADDGRNWSRYVPLVCSSGIGPGCARLAERILEDATREYNLQDPA